MVVYAIERLQRLKIADVVRKDIVTVSSHQTMREAATILARQEISGVPVVDDHNHCIGILTATDFLQTEALLGVDHLGADLLPVRGCKKSCHQAPVNQELVGDHMTRTLQPVRSKDSLLAAARAMSAYHVHCILVIDDYQHPIGVLTTLDILHAIVSPVHKFQDQGCSHETVT